MNKLFTITICVLLIIAHSSAQAQLKLPKEDQFVKFSWLSDTTNHRTEPYSAMLIPVKLNGCPEAFYMQFDLGAPHSLLYSGELKAILSKYPATDTNTFVVTKSNNRSKVIIGTIGEDFIDGKILVIDYPKKKLYTYADLPKKLSRKTALSTFMLMKGSVLLPAILNGKQTVLFFDTGSSAFELLTSKAVSDHLAIPDASTKSYPVKTWGKTLTANTRPTSDSLSIAGQKLPIKQVTYIEGASDSQVSQMLKLGIGGMTGNKLFLNYMLIIDTKNKKFGITH